MFYNLLPGALQALLASVLWPSPAPLSSNSKLQFELRHEHGLSASSRVVFSDIKPVDSLTPNVFFVNTRRTQVHKPAAQTAFQSARFHGGDVTWDGIEVDGPDVQDRGALLMLAEMANNAYTEPDQKDWYDLGPEWNNVSGPRLPGPSPSCSHLGSHLVLPVRLGAGRGRLPGPRLCDPGQLHCRRFY